MIDLDEFAKAMSDYGVDSPTRKSLLWLAGQINEKNRTQRERLDKTLSRLWFYVRGRRF